MNFESKRTLLKEIFNLQDQDNDMQNNNAILVKGWLRSVRKTKNFSFLVLNDGSCQDTIQIIYDQDRPMYSEVSNLLTGSCVGIIGKLVKSNGKGQSFEIQADSIHIYGKTDANYPLQKKAASLEFLREKAHLRPRTNLFSAIFRIRHVLAMAVHEFFDSKGFYYLNSPILTAVDAEGAGEMFNVTTFSLKNLDKLPKDKSSLDYKKDYFGKEVSLCVTGQLEGECFAMGLGSVYTFGPTFRAENSNTPRHLSEFWMIEPEIAFFDLEQTAELAADFVKFLIKSAFDKCPKELAALDSYHKFAAKSSKSPFNSHLDSLKEVMNSDFKKITYTEAIDILLSSKEKFEFEPKWGIELQTEHERFLSEKYFKAPVTVTDYPKSCKAFYMKLNDDGKTVRAMDLLVPGVGEIIGGSQREEDLDKIKMRMDELGMDQKPLWWYLELRQFGTAPHSGFGLGFERVIRYITGMNNIRDVIAFPRTPKSCDF